MYLVVCSWIYFFRRWRRRKYNYKSSKEYLSANNILLGKGVSQFIEDEAELDDPDEEKEDDDEDDDEKIGIFK